MLSRALPWLMLAACAALMLGLAIRFDFFCDDAFIVLRYAQNLAQHGAPVYNPGERVEGYTSLSWLLLTTLGAVAALPLPRFVQCLGALSGVGLLAASYALFTRLQPGRVLTGGVVLLALAVSAPVAAWTLGGLETPLFAALVTASLCLALDVRREPSARRGAVLGLILGLSAITRPEGMLVAGVVLPLLTVPLFGSAPGRRAVLCASAVCAGMVAAHVGWRLFYYGYPLPNTYYIKSSGDPALLRERGLGYLHLAASELGPWVTGAALVGLLAAGWGGTSSEAAARRLLAWIARLLVPAYVLYVGAVGGDFLDLYRFFVPLLPLCFVLAASAVLERGGVLGRGWLGALLGAAIIVGYGAHQHSLAERAKQVREDARKEQGIEPIGWTRLYALRWAAMGRWIARHARPEDWMAVGAAGAMPYYAGVRNIDTFGLCDAWVAHNAPIVGNRPGHQRFAPISYVLSKQPVFLLIGNDYTSDTPRPLRSELRWEQRGYIWVEARVEAAEFGAPADYYHYFLMRADRARARTSRWLRTSEGG